MVLKCSLSSGKGICINRYACYSVHSCSDRNLSPPAPHGSMEGGGGWVIVTSEMFPGEGNP